MPSRLGPPLPNPLVGEGRWEASPGQAIRALMPLPAGHPNTRPAGEGRGLGPSRVPQHFSSWDPKHWKGPDRGEYSAQLRQMTPFRPTNEMWVSDISDMLTWWDPSPTLLHSHAYLPQISNEGHFRRHENCWLPSRIQSQLPQIPVFQIIQTHNMLRSLL